MTDNERKPHPKKASIVIGAWTLVCVIAAGGSALWNFRSWGDVLYGAIFGTIVGVVAGAVNVAMNRPR